MNMESGLLKLSAIHNEKAKSQARERISLLFDDGLFTELDPLFKSEKEGTGVIAAYGAVNGAPAYAYAQDHSVLGGAVGKAEAAKIIKIYDLAAKTGIPVVSMFDSSGAYLKEGNDVLDAYSKILFWANNLSGVVPQISLVLGTCGGSASLIAASSDILILSEKGKLFLAPDLEDDSTDGLAQIVVADDAQAISKAREIVSLLPLNNLSASPFAEYDDPAVAMDNQHTIEACADPNTFIEIQKGFGRNVVAGLARIGGQAVAVARTNGPLGCQCTSKLARLIRFADAFSIPMVTFIDVERFKSARDAAKLAHAYAEATTVKLSVITGSAIGPAFIALAGKSANADLVLAWPCAVISPLSPEAAVSVLWNDKLADLKNPLTERAALVTEYIDTEASPFTAAAGGYIDDVIDPAETRIRLATALDMLAGKRISRLPKKHSNIQL